MTAPDHIRDLAAFVRAAPTSFHAAAEGARRLAAAGFTEQSEIADWDDTPGGHYVVRGGALIAWRSPETSAAAPALRIVGAHTDSPGFVLKPRPDLPGDGWQRLGVEVYGGPLLNSWLDRDLGLAGQVVLADGSVRLVQTGAIMRIPQLAIHLDRGVNDDGLKLDKQLHLQPVWSVGHPELRFADYLAELLGVAARSIDGYDLAAYDTAEPAFVGARQDFLACGRLDNLTSVHAGLRALIDAPAGPAIQLLAAFDHEELGSASRTGASGPLLADVLDRILTARGATSDQRHEALAGSWCVSADAGHGVHPNYPGRHDPANRPLLNDGPLLKINANQRYATDALGSALWRRTCRAAGVPVQEFVSSNAIPCGSTIGPLTATRLGIPTLDVGVPLLSMHSVRELAGTQDPYALSRALAAFLAAST